jgi:hypothetical protein
MQQKHQTEQDDAGHGEQDGSDHQSVAREAIGVGTIHHTQDQHEEWVGQQQGGKVFNAQMAEKQAFGSRAADTDTHAP